MRKADLIARTGMIYTNGTDYGREIFLAEGVDSSAYYEISHKEYLARLEAASTEE